MMLPRGVNDRERKKRRGRGGKEPGRARNACYRKRGVVPVGEGSLKWGAWIDPRDSPDAVFTSRGNDPSKA